MTKIKLTTPLMKTKLIIWTKLVRLMKSGQWHPNICQRSFCPEHSLVSTKCSKCYPIHKKWMKRYENFGRPNLHECHHGHRGRGRAVKAAFTLWARSTIHTWDGTRTIRSIHTRSWGRKRPTDHVFLLCAKPNMLPVLCCLPAWDDVLCHGQAEDEVVISSTKDM